MSVDILTRLRPLIQAVEARRAESARVILALDGMSAAGKTTAAAALAARWDAPVVHMDDFFLPLDLRTPARLAEPGGNVHYERFETEVLPFLRGPGGFSYRRFDCGVLDYRGAVDIPPAGVVIVEGAYALHPRFGAYGDVTAFFAVTPEEQRRRILVRSDPAKWKDFRTRWIPLENAYHSAFSVRERADFIIET